MLHGLGKRLDQLKPALPLEVRPDEQEAELLALLALLHPWSRESGDTAPRSSQDWRPTRYSATSPTLRNEHPRHTLLR